jgi:cysteine protease ATG4
MFFTDWRWHLHQRKYDVVFHHQIIKFFGDLPSDECPFSIHRLVQIGATSGKKPGDWYGPASVAYVLR